MSGPDAKERLPGEIGGYRIQRVLGTGAHSLAFTPNVARVYVRLQNKLVRKVLVDSCTIEGAGAMTVTAPWAQADLDFLRFAQSADVVYLETVKYASGAYDSRPELVPISRAEFDNMTGRAGRLGSSRCHGRNPYRSRCRDGDTSKRARGDS